MSSPLLPHHAQPRRVERQGALALGGEECLDGLLTPGQHLRGHEVTSSQAEAGAHLDWDGLLPDAGEAHRAPVHVQHRPAASSRGRGGEAGQVAPRVLVVHEQPEVEAAEVAGAEAEGEARPRPRQTLLDRPRPVALPRYEVRTGVPGAAAVLL